MDTNKSEKHLEEIAKNIKKLRETIEITANVKTGEKVDVSGLQNAGAQFGAAAIGALASPVPGGRPAAAVLGLASAGSFALANLSEGKDETVSRVFTLNEALETFSRNLDEFNRAADKLRGGSVDADGFIKDGSKPKQEQFDALSENRAIAEGILNARSSFAAKLADFRQLSGGFLPDTPAAQEALRNLQATERVLREIALIAKDPETRQLLSMAFGPTGPTVDALKFRSQQSRLPKAGPSTPLLDGLGRPLTDDRIRPGFSGGDFLGGSAGDDVLFGGARLDEAEDTLLSFSAVLGELPGEFTAAREAAEDYGGETRSLNGLLEQSNLQFTEQTGLIGALRQQLPELGGDFVKIFDETTEHGRELNRVVLGLGTSFFDAFTQAAFEGRELSDVLKELLQDILRIPQSSGGGLSFLGGLFDFLGLSTFFAGGPGPGAGPPLRVARGGVFDKGRSITALARGGALTNRILKTPTLFPLADGLGLAGEAGPEAVLPLTRLSDGKLGVLADLPRMPEGLPRIPDVPAQMASSAVNQQFVFNIDARGADREGLREVKALIRQVRGEVVETRRMIGPVALRTVLDSRRRGGNIAKAFGAR